MTDSRGKAAPGAGDTHRGLALSFGGSLGGTPLTSYSKAKGRRTGRYRAPFSFLKVPTARKEKIGNSEYKIAAWLGRETRVVIGAFSSGPAQTPCMGLHKGHSIQAPPVHIRGPTRPNGAAVDRFWGITLSGMARCHPRVVPSPQPVESHDGGSGR